MKIICVRTRLSLLRICRFNFNFHPIKYLLCYWGFEYLVFFCFFYINSLPCWIVSVSFLCVTPIDNIWWIFSDGDTRPKTACEYRNAILLMVLSTLLYYIVWLRILRFTYRFNLFISDVSLFFICAEINCEIKMQVHRNMFTEDSTRYVGV